jgi:LmbE family N-acetylglucosaminyl deacetylase
MEEKLVPYKAVSRIAGDRVLVLAPHPDDEVFGCGGAIMRHVDAGNVLQVVIVSDGEYRVDASQQLAYRKLRQAESQQAAKVMGCGSPIFWGIPDRAVEYGEYLIGRITDAINALEADLVYAPSVFEMHPDHRAVGMAALESVRRHAAKPQLAMYEVGVPMPRVNTLLDISHLVDRKQSAMKCFVSQLGEQSYDEHIAALNRYRTYTLGGDATAAEGYLVASGDALSRDFLGLYVSEYERQRELGLAIASEDVPLVSVLIRSMDRPLLREALDSVALQTYPHIEVVVINARVQTHRALGDLCGRFPIRLVNTVTPLHRSQAANAALANAKGDYLIFLDDDDWLAPDHIANLVSTIRAHSDCDVAYAGVEFRANDRQRLDMEPFNESFNAGRLRGGNYIPIHAILFAHKLLAKGVHFDERFDVYEDWDFLLQLSARTKFVHTDHVSAYYRASGTSGVGAIADAEAKRRARAQIFDKWKAIWTGAELDDLVLGTTDVQLEKFNKQLDSANKQLDSVRSSLVANLVEVQGQLDGKILALAAKEDEIKNLEKDLEELRSINNSLQTLQSQLEQEIFSSTSWYVTRPLRWFARRLRTLKQVLSDLLH